MEAVPPPKVALFKKGPDGHLRLEKARLARLTTYEPTGGWRDIIDENEEIHLKGLDHYERKAYNQAQRNGKIYVPLK
jgi:hypothetical protein